MFALVNSSGLYRTGAWRPFLQIWGRWISTAKIERLVIYYIWFILKTLGKSGAEIGAIRTMETNIGEGGNAVKRDLSLQSLQGKKKELTIPGK